jgi:hypothetical protein
MRCQPPGTLTLLACGTSLRCHTVPRSHVFRGPLRASARASPRPVVILRYEVFTALTKVWSWMHLLLSAQLSPNSRSSTTFARRHTRRNHRDSDQPRQSRCTTTGPPHSIVPDELADRYTRVVPPSDTALIEPLRVITCMLALVPILASAHRAREPLSAPGETCAYLRLGPRFTAPRFAEWRSRKCPR